MKLKQQIQLICAILILVLVAQECDAIKSSRKSSTGRGSSGSSNSGSSGSWWSRGTSGASSSSSHKVNPSSTNHKKPPEPSAPRYEEKKPIGWNVPGTNPGAPPAYSNTHTRGLSNPSQQNPPPYSVNSPPGHQTIQSSNNVNQYAGLNYPRNTGQSTGHVGGVPYSNVPNQNQGLNYPRNTGQQYSGYPGAVQQSHMPNTNQGYNYPRNTGQQYPSGYSGGHYSNQFPGTNYGVGGYGGHPGYSNYGSPGYFASGYPIGGGNYGKSSSGNTLTNALLAGSVGLGLYNAIRPYPSHSGGGYGGSTVHNHYYNNQPNQPNAVQTSAVQTSAQAPINPQSNQNVAVETQPPLAPFPQAPPANNSSGDPSAALVTPLPELTPNDKITDLDCVYAMKILNCTEISQCPQEWLHPSCLNRTISKEYFDSIELPPPPPIPQTQPETNVSEPASVLNNLTTTNQSGNVNQNLYSANGQQQPVLSSPSRAAAVDSLCLVILLGMAKLVALTF